jgi:hypothetical protein
MSRNRNELLDAVVDRVANELGDDPRVPRSPEQGWRPYLNSMTHGVRRPTRAHHPSCVPLVTMLTTLAGEGFGDEQRK